MRTISTPVFLTCVVMAVIAWFARKQMHERV